MIIRLSSLKCVAFLAVSFLACNNSVMRKVPINQIFVVDKFKAFNILHENGDCDLQIYSDGQLIFEQEISKTPCIIKSISKDTILVDRLLLQKPPQNNQSLNAEYERIDDKKVLQLRDRYFTGSMNEGTLLLDSSHITNNSLICYHQSGIDTLALNELLFTGEEFYTNRFKGLIMSTTLYKVEDEKFLERYWLDYTGKVAKQ